MYILFSPFFVELIHLYNELLQVVDLPSSWLKEKRVSLNIRQFPDEWPFIVDSHAMYLSGFHLELPSISSQSP